MVKEIELKLALPASAHRQVLRHTLIRDAERLEPAQTLINTYYDTPAQTLSAARVALRTRKAGKRWLQTVKCAAVSQGGLSSRPEWECAYHGRFDFSAIDAPDVRSLLEAQADSIVPLFTTNFRRHTFVLRPRAGIEIHLMLDAGEVQAGNQQEAISELELELVSGSAADLLWLACELAETLPLRPYDESKAARGYRLFRGEPVQAQNTRILNLQGDQPALDSLRRIAHSLLADWAANLDGALRNPGDPVFVHQQRIALRRLRACLQVFTPLWPQGKAWIKPLGELAQELGAPRMLRVLADEQIAPLQGQAEGISLLYQALLAASVAQQTQILAGNHAARAGQTMLGLMAALPDENASPTPLAKHARSCLRKLSREALRRLKKTCAKRPASLHALRIAGKRLRYAAEFFAGLYPERAMQRRLLALGKLQDELGRINDISQLAPTLQTLVEQQPALASPAGYACGWYAVTATKSRRRMLRNAARHLTPANPWDKR
ncbi:MAG: hypothetical protein BSR46_02270 [Candidatus Dactylopiibacterium carminicum]|nr:CYTH and CHAD domain-containing protein [Candidatus Dactylopiibacterium carminicum]PAT00560.1 MAG: hypothetical protein BSR46_02270 [Candidatus Dactylopiibacterium carminicum]